MSDYGHATVMKPRLPIGLFNVVCWILGAAGFLVVLFVLQTLLCVVPAIVFLLVGWPVPGAGSPPRWVYIQWRRYQDAQNDGGYIHRRSALQGIREKGDEATAWDLFEIVRMQYTDKGGVIKEWPFIWTPDNNYLTSLIEFDGMPLGYLNGSSDTKLAHQSSFMHVLARSLQSAPPGTTHYGLTTLYYPADQSATNEDLHRRGNPDIIDALKGEYSPDFVDEVDVQLADNTREGVDQVYGSDAAQPLSFAFIRVPWPKKGGKRIKLDDPQAFAASPTFRLLNRYVGAFEQAGLGPTVMSKFQIAQTLLRMRCLRDLEIFQERATYDRALVELGHAASLDETTSAQLEHSKPVSTRYDSSGQLIVDGTGIMAGFVDEVYQPNISPVDRELLFDFSPGTWWAYTLYGFVMGARGRRIQSKRKERIVQAINKVDESISGPVSNPEGDLWLQSVQDERAAMATAGSRTGTWSNVFSVRADPQDTLGIMAEASDRLRSTYEIRPVYTKDQISDLILSQTGVMSNK